MYQKSAAQQEINKYSFKFCIYSNLKAFESYLPMKPEKNIFTQNKNRKIFQRHNKLILNHSDELLIGLRVFQYIIIIIIF